MQQEQYDAIVVGKGLMGVAAARYLAEALDRVALVGPGEPPDWATHDGVFSSHYDSGRITRVLDPQLLWAQLALNSIEAYGEIEARSGSQFYYPSGCLSLGPAGDDRLAATGNVGTALGRAFELWDDAQMRQRQPLLNFPSNYIGVYEGPPAGHVDPRAYVEATLTVGRQAGLTYIDDRVVSVTAGPMAGVKLASGRQLQAAQVLVAAGAYSNTILPEKLQFTMAPRTILKARVSGAEADRIRTIPSLIGREAPGTDLLEGFYSVPVMRYPDGQEYFKIGGQVAGLVDTTSIEEVNEWFRTGGGREETEALKQVLTTLIVDLQPDGYDTKPCVINHTASGFPYVDHVGENVIIVSGGHGSAAKSANEIGRLGALLALGEPWPDYFDKSVFRARFA